MEIQQHDGVVVEAAVISAGLRQAPTREREVLRGEREAPRARVRLPSLPPNIYRPPRGGAGPRRSHLQGGRRPRGGTCPPSQVGRPTTPMVSNPRRRGGPRGAHQPTRGWFPSQFSPWGPPG